MTSEHRPAGGEVRNHVDLGKRSVPGKKEYPVQALREGRVRMFRESQGGQRERS